MQWYSVGVRLVRTVSPQLSLQQLRAEPSLAGMDLFLRSRLSIQVGLLVASFGLLYFLTRALAPC